MASSLGHVEAVKLLLASPGIDYNHTNTQVRKRAMYDVQLLLL
jgi:hypothetical protein